MVDVHDPNQIRWTRVSPGTVGPRVDWAACMHESDYLLEFLARADANAETVLIVINDPHRDTPTAPVLRNLAEIVRRRFHRVRFVILVATGTHQFDSRVCGEFERATCARGALPIDDFRWHDATDDAMMSTIDGIRVNNWIETHSYLMPIGSVEPHYFAGVTGPHKTLTIGCMAIKDIERNHALALDVDAEPLRLFGNPVFEHIMSCLQVIESANKAVCAVAECVVDGQIVNLSIGRAIDTVHELLTIVRATFHRSVAAPVDVLHLRVPPPLGDTLYQADKALKNNCSIVRKGGGIVLEADCRNGVGPGDFLRLLETNASVSTAMRTISDRGYRLGDHKAVRLLQLTDPDVGANTLAFVSSGLAESGDMLAGFPVFADVSSALNWLGEMIQGTFRRGMIVENAGHVCTSLEAGTDDR